jgi:hypothetical protein
VRDTLHDTSLLYLPPSPTTPFIHTPTDQPPTARHDDPVSDRRPEPRFDAFDADLTLFDVGVDAVLT